MAPSCQLIGYQRKYRIYRYIFGVSNSLFTNKGTLLKNCAVKNVLMWHSYNTSQMIKLALKSVKSQALLTHWKNSLKKLAGKTSSEKTLYIKLVKKVWINLWEKTHWNKLVWKNYVVGIKFVIIKFSEKVTKSTFIILNPRIQGSNRPKKRLLGILIWYQCTLILYNFL